SRRRHPAARRRCRLPPGAGPGKGACREQERYAWTPAPARYGEPYSRVIRRLHREAHQLETLECGFGDVVRTITAPLDAVLDDLERMNGVLIVVLGMLLEPPAAARADFLVLGEPAQRLFGDLLRHAFDGVVGRGDGCTELGVAAHLGQVGVEFLRLGEHRFRFLEPLLGYVEP